MKLTRRAVGKAAALGLAGLAVPHWARAQTPRRGGTLRMVYASEPSTLVPITNNALAGFQIGPKMTEGLLKYDLDFNPQPQLATAWAVSSDGLQYTFKLRPGVNWSDGQEFTSADVAYSIMTLKRVGPRAVGTFANITDVRTPDPLTAVIVLSAPASYLIKAFTAAETPIFPRHLFEGKDLTTNPAQLKPTGTGPFLLTEWVRGSHIILDRNPNYWDQLKPYLDRIIIRFVTDDAARIAAFESDEVDIGGNTPVPQAELARIKSLPGLGLETNGYRYLGTQNQFVFNLESQYLRNQQVREAIAHAVNLQELLDNVWFDYGTISPAVVTVGEPFHDPGITPRAYDPAMSARLLDAAGFKVGSDGTRFSLQIVPNTSTIADIPSAQFLAQALRKIGIRGVVRNYDATTYTRVVFTDHNYDIDISNLSNLFDPQIGVRRVVYSKAYEPGLPFSNGGHYSNPKVDQLLDAAAVEADFDKRKQMYFEMQEIVDHDLPLISTIRWDNFTVYNKRVHDFAVTIDGMSGNFSDVYLA